MRYDVDMSGENDGSKYGEASDSNFPVWYDRPGAIERFRFVIRQAGGFRVVASLSGVPKGTIENLLRGTDVRISAAYAIAAACHVSLDWLATGIGPETPEWYVPGPTSGSALAPLDAQDPRRDLAASVLAQPSAKMPPAMREHQEPLVPPPLINTAVLRQAIDIVKSLDGVQAFEADNFADRVAGAYNILSGAKP
jgi:hypothetical protein